MPAGSGVAARRSGKGGGGWITASVMCPRVSAASGKNTTTAMVAIRAASRYQRSTAAIVTTPSAKPSGLFKNEIISVPRTPSSSSRAKFNGTSISAHSPTRAAILSQRWRVRRTRTRANQKSAANPSRFIPSASNAAVFTGILL